MKDLLNQSRFCTKPRLRVTELGEFIRFHSCERRFKLGFDNRALAKQLPFAERLFSSLDPVLQAVGRLREDEWERSLRDSAGLTALSDYAAQHEDPEHSKAIPWSVFVDQAKQLKSGEQAYAREVKVEGSLGAFHIEGRIDFVIVLWRGGQPYLRLVECKASRRDRTYQRVQLGAYLLLVEQFLETLGLEIAGTRVGPENIECVVARIDESTNENQAILELPPLDLSPILEDVRRLLAEDGGLIRILEADLSELPYKLEPKCDGCVFNIHCFPESARLRSLELLGLSPSYVRALRSAGVKSIDDLKNLDPRSFTATQVLQTPGFNKSLSVLVAKARARSSTLPDGDVDPDTYQVKRLPIRWQSQLPEHVIEGQRLVRVYLVVDYDYTENRIGALSAHVTSSDWPLHTGFQKVDGCWEPTPMLQERFRSEDGTEQLRDVQGEDVIRIKTSKWSGFSEQDRVAERELIQDFFSQLVEAIAKVAEEEAAPIHFYVWSRSEMAQLVEGCSRAGSDLLSSLQHLLGCRESLEQLIFSCLQEETDNCFGLGWTSRGLAVVTSLRWFGEVYHWRRQVGSRVLSLDHEMTQDIFDFKTDLYIMPDGSWASEHEEGAKKHKFEIRSRFFDGLPAPYWHAYWKNLNGLISDRMSPQLRSAVERYNNAAKISVLREYLRARSHALRWLEERIRFKNPDIVKPALVIAELQDFRLGIDSVAQAAVDFLRLEQHVKVAEWVAAHLAPPAYRVPTGRTIPLRNVRVDAKGLVRATIDVSGYGITLEELEARVTFQEGDFVRVTPYSGDPQDPQTVKQLFKAGNTCVVERLDWANAEVTLKVRPQLRDGDRYRLFSRSLDSNSKVCEHATLDESPSDYVAVRVDERLMGNHGAHIYRWFNQHTPEIPRIDPLSEDERALHRQLAESIRFTDNTSLAPDQIEAVLEGLETRVQLLQGPPGTGKTQVTAVAVLLRALAHLSIGSVVLVSAHTHTAVDNLLERIAMLLPAVTQAANKVGLFLPKVTLIKMHSSLEQKSKKPLVVAEELLSRAPGLKVTNDVAESCASAVKDAISGSIVIIGGTTGTLLKMAKYLNSRKPFSDRRHRFQSDLLVVDEASMMVFPHYLALASLVAESGQIMLAGDHRQLAPILTHDWEEEDRPPTVLYQPFVSAYDAVQNICSLGSVPLESARRSALKYTFRLPKVIRSLIARLYLRDNIDLQGPPQLSDSATPSAPNPLEAVWQPQTGLFLVVHDERESHQHSPIEAEIIEKILVAGGLLPEKSVAVITPHRSQRTLLKTRLQPHRSAVDIIDTVERLQGGQRPNVLFSATVSDPADIAANAEFILDLNRSNVAFSRAQQRLIVVCSETLLNYVPPELEKYESALLWKSLRSLCTVEIGTAKVGGHTVRILQPDRSKVQSIADRS